MIDRENTIENLEQNIRWIEEIECHQFPGWANVTMAMRDAVELLKEQEPVKPVEAWNTYLCGNCNRNVYHEERQGFLVLYDERDKYCPNCGRKVKWDDVRNHSD